ncbi:MAG: hypothetical protein MJE77_42600 [Proteobacteria bacterium]|nr:hypothetical protein [Pseudomonadota bacterium]
MNPKHLISAISVGLLTAGIGCGEGTIGETWAEVGCDLFVVYASDIYVGAEFDTSWSLVVNLKDHPVLLEHWRIVDANQGVEAKITDIAMELHLAPRTYIGGLLEPQWLADVAVNIAPGISPIDIENIKYYDGLISLDISDNRYQNIYSIHTQAHQIDEPESFAIGQEFACGQ